MHHIAKDKLDQIVDAYCALPAAAKATPEDHAHPLPHDDLDPFLGLLHLTGFTGDFDWPEWLSQQTMEHLDEAAYLDSANLDTLRRLMTSHQRSERFAPGHLQGLFASGYMDRFIERLRALAAQM